MEPSDPTLVAERVGRRIAELRRTRDMTQESFAEALGRPVLYVRRVELATTNPTVVALIEIANVLDCKVTTLFTAPKSMTVKPGRIARSILSLALRIGSLSVGTAFLGAALIPIRAFTIATEVALTLVLASLAGRTARALARQESPESALR